MLPALGQHHGTRLRPSSLSPLRAGVEDGDRCFATGLPLEGGARWSLASSARSGAVGGVSDPRTAPQRLFDLLFGVLLRPRVRRLRRWAFVVTLPLGVLIGHRPRVRDRWRDRLERAGYVRRVRDDVDRRRVLVELTDEAHRRTGEIWGPIAEASTGWLARYSDEELLLIRDVLRSSREFLNEHLERIKALPRASGKSGDDRGPNPPSGA